MHVEKRPLSIPNIRLQIAAITLSEELNFTRAADRLKITQPALSKQIVELEKRLGFAVFKRDQKRVELTDAGQVFIRGCRDALAILERSVRTGKSAQDEMEPLITIGHSPYVDPCLISALLAIHLPLHPGLRLRMESMFAMDLAHGVLAAELDLAIISEPSENPLLTLVPIGSAPLPKQLAGDLQAWRLECEEKAREAFAKGKRTSASLSPDDFIFENEDGGFLDTDNYRKRVLHKVARDLQLPKLTFQVIRRTIATLAQKKGTIKDVQGVMRHSRTATTTDVYMQEIPASVQSTINSINSEVRKSDAKTRKKSKEPAPAGTVVSGRRKPSTRVTQNDTKSLRGGSERLPAYA